MSWKHWTLTITSQPNLTPMLDDLIAAFRRLRQTPLWRQNVRGGVYTVECTHSTAGWHVHLHVMCVARYIPHALMVALWTRITGSCIVWVTRPPAGRITTYITKYITKVDVPDADRYELNEAFAHRRLWSPFGVAHDIIRRCPRYRMHCPSCDNDSWTSLQFIRWTPVDSLAPP